MKSYIIAECGTAHQAGTDRNRFIKALGYCVKAADAGADCVKFQLFIPNEPLFCPMPGDDARWDRWTDSMMPEDDWQEIKGYAESIGLDFLVSVFQRGALDMAKRLGCKRIKVASRAANSFPYDKWDGGFVISRGLVDGPSDLALGDRAKWLQCRMEYPTPLNAAIWHASYYDGLSDHSGNPWVAIDAMARGCPMVELHVDGMPGSISWDQLKLVCEARDAFAQMRPD